MRIFRNPFFRDDSVADPHESRWVLPTVLGASGGLLLTYAAKRRSMPALLAGAAGGHLIYRGYQALRRNADPREAPYGTGVMVKESTTVEKPAAELYALWRDFENLPAFMTTVEAVETIDSRKSHWRVSGPAGRSIGWDAEVIADRPNELIGWRTLEGQTVAHAGSVRFQAFDDAPERTRVTVTLQFNPPAGKAGAAVARLAGADPHQQVRDDLNRFKRFAESMDLAVLDRLQRQRRRSLAMET